MKTLAEYASAINARLEELFPEAKSGAFENGGRPWIVNNAMRYSIMAGGKRLRPAMLMAACDMLGGNMDIALDFGCAVEMIHTYSLIHDDLPGMDDDVLRRGRPTNHVVFGVGQAILAGDGLLNCAFETMLAAVMKRGENERAYVRAMREIAEGAGARGMVGGQCMDLECERAGSGGADELKYIHINKTARMFIHPLRAAAAIAEAGEAEMSAITEYGEAFGILFQATDDLLDVIGDQQAMGKTLGKDAESGKLTCVSVYGIDGTRELIERLLNRAVKAMSVFGDKAGFFIELIQNTAIRTQ